MGEPQRTPNAQYAGTGIDLHQFLKVLRNWHNLIIALTLISTIGVGLYSYYVLSPVYQAKTLLMVTVASSVLPTSSTPVPRTSQSVPVLTINTYLEQLKSEKVMKRVLDKNDLPGQTIGSLTSMINANIIPQSNLIELKVSNTDPVLAAKIANAVADQYVQLMNELTFSPIIVVSQANIPISPISPNKKINIAMAFLAGLVLSVLLAFLLEYLDNTLKTAEDIKRELNLSVLGIIPVKNARNIQQSQYGGNK